MLNIVRNNVSPTELPLLQLSLVQRKSLYIAVEAFVLMLAERTGLEPATPGVTGRYSNQLNYHSNTANRLPRQAARSRALYRRTGNMQAHSARPGGNDFQDDTDRLPRSAQSGSNTAAIKAQAAEKANALGAPACW